MEVYDNDNLKDEKEIESGGETKRDLSKNQKIAAIFLAVFSVFVIILWIAQLNKNINDPFSYNSEETSKNNMKACSGPDCLGSDEFLKINDTDKDGLFDWDELNVYQTSPYLEDSDSDGLTDRQEIEAGTDPNCPIGRDCSPDVGSGASENKDSLSSGLGQDASALKNAGETTPDQEKILSDVLSGQGDVNVLRDMLLQSGMDKESLDKISDEDLMASYEEVLKGQ